MSLKGKMRTFGSAFAISTSGPDAVEDFGVALGQVRDVLRRHVLDTMMVCHYLGYRMDEASLEVNEVQEDEAYVVSWTMQGQQTVPLWRRIWKAVRA